MHRSAATIILHLFLSLTVPLCAATARATEPARYVDSDEAKDSSYNRTCAISDHSVLVEQEQVKWGWVAPGVKLASYERVDLAPVKNMSDTTDPKVGPATTEAFKDAFDRIGKTIGPGGLKMKACIYWLQRASGERGMVPYVGFYLAQAGVGIEVEITDAKGAPLARIRHDGRQAGGPDDASFELVDEIVNFIRDH